ncbi:hypothetical protein RHCRD62_30127 [Rhodococcus sp. RD6.2]|nr:hypothetical protein RHCRD62_30127 [Rhodococcus sp. RD6.2]
MLGGRRQLPVGDLVRRVLRRLTLLLAVRVDVGVRQDAVQPGLEIGARLEGPERRIRLDVRLLHQILGVGRVPRHTQRRAVQLVEQRQRVALETLRQLGLGLLGRGRGISRSAVVGFARVVGHGDPFALVGNPGYRHPASDTATRTPTRGTLQALHRHRRLLSTRTNARCNAPPATPVPARPSVLGHGRLRDTRNPGFDQGEGSAPGSQLRPRSEQRLVRHRGGRRARCDARTRRRADLQDAGDQDRRRQARGRGAAGSGEALTEGRRGGARVRQSGDGGRGRGAAVHGLCARRHLPARTA